MTKSSTDLQDAIALLTHRHSPKRRMGARRLRKLQDPTAGPALLQALEQEVRDPRTWETQYQMIMALGTCHYTAAVPLLRRLAAAQFEATMVYVAIGDALVRLARAEPNDGRPVFELMHTGNPMLMDGAFRAMAMLRMTPDEAIVNQIIDTATQLASQHDQHTHPAMRVDLRFWVAAAAPGWSGPRVTQFLEACLAVPNDQLRRAAQTALAGKYLAWNPL